MMIRACDRCTKRIPPGDRLAVYIDTGLNPSLWVTDEDAGWHEYHRECARTLTIGDIMPAQKPQQRRRRRLWHRGA